MLLDKLRKYYFETPIEELRKDFENPQELKGAIKLMMSLKNGIA